MKANRVKLAEWTDANTSEYIDIPWPVVHSQTPPDAVAWLTAQCSVSCQLVLEKIKNMHSLWVEFYDPILCNEYFLKFGK